MLKWLFGKKKVIYPMLAHSRGLSQDIVGEGHFQSDLEQIAGPKEKMSAKYECEATSVCESDTKHDSDAVAVYLGRGQVGHLFREGTKLFREVLVSLIAELSPVNAKAKIVGGWKNDISDGSYGIKLNLKRPLALVKENPK
ncbi:hypothetical protein [uncultured Boseongicola sp.]|jgi:hypothetical protein|uniref:hypothetical protein n=1 Tax=uncultured Boseongicola sp. TaxID=1648499 RepID=UPI00262BBC61|nr:hypothetical protein [uncultured Boseongicola sp.]